MGLRGRVSALRGVYRRKREEKNYLEKVIERAAIGKVLGFEQPKRLIRHRLKAE